MTYNSTWHTAASVYRKISLKPLIPKFRRADWEGLSQPGGALEGKQGSSSSRLRLPRSLSWYPNEVLGS